jgi:hypothetical protein
VMGIEGLGSMSTNKLTYTLSQLVIKLRFLVN